MKKLHLFKTVSTGPKGGTRTVWVLANDRGQTLHRGWTRRSCVDFVNERYAGVPVTLVRYAGATRPSELAMTLGVMKAKAQAEARAAVVGGAR